jgi:hypothetical protein
MDNVQLKHSMFFQNPLRMLNMLNSVKAHNLHITILALS